MNNFSIDWKPFNNSINIGNSAQANAYSHTINEKASNRYVSCRQSATYYNGFIFSMQVRSKWGSADDPMTYLDLQATPFRASESDSPNQRDCFGWKNEEALTAQLSVAGRNTETEDRFITAFCAGSLGGAFATWIKVDGRNPEVKEGSPKLALNVYPIELEDNKFVFPSQSKINTIYLKSPSEGNNLRDMCCTVIGDRAVYFCNFWNDPTVYYFLFDGENVSDFVSMSGLGEFIAMSEIFSIDATTIHSNWIAEMGNGTTGKSLWSAQQVALTICFVGDGGNNIQTYAIRPECLLELGDKDCMDRMYYGYQNIRGTVVGGENWKKFNSPNSRFNWMQNFGDKNFPIWPNVSIRTVWGSPKLSSDSDAHPIQNGLMIFFEMENSDRFRWYSVPCLLTAVIDLDKENNSNDLPYKQQPTNRYFQVGMSFTTGIICKGKFLDDSNSSAGYAAVYGVCYRSTNSDTPYTGYMFLAQFPSYILSNKSSTVKAQDPFSWDWTANEFRAAMECWTAVGIIAGLPPVPKDSNVSSSLRIQFEKSKTASSSVSRTSTFGIELSSGSIGFSGEFSYQYESDISRTITEDLSEDFVYTNKQVEEDAIVLKPKSVYLPPDYGLMLFYMPVYSRYDYHVRTWDKKHTKIKLFVLFVEGGAILSYKFNLKNPHLIVEDSSIPKALRTALATFSDQVPQWPETDDVEAWEKIPESFYRKLVKNPDKMKTLSQMGVNKDTSPDYTNCFSHEEEFKLESTNSLKVGSSLKLPVFSLGASVSYSAKTTFSYKGGDSFLLEFIYDVPEDPKNLSEFIVIPKLCIADQENLPWIPTPMANQSPWLLTWDISS